MGSDVAVLSTAALADTRGRIAPEALRAEVEEIKTLMRSVLEEGVDFGRIPGTPKPTLFKSGAEWLLRWARLGHRLERVDTERDAEGRPYGTTYRCTIFVLGEPDSAVATCDGYCGYDEPDREAHLNRSNKPIPRAPWNTIIKMASKRALVGATLQATAASGLFTQDVEDMAPSPPSASPDAEAWFRANGWADKAEHDEWRQSRIAALKQVAEDSPEDIPRIKAWQEDHGLRWSAAIPRPLAVVFDEWCAQQATASESPTPAVPTPTPTPAPTPPNLSSLAWGDQARAMLHPIIAKLGSDALDAFEEWTANRGCPEWWALTGSELRTVSAYAAALAGDPALVERLNTDPDPTDANPEGLPGGDPF